MTDCIIIGGGLSGLTTAYNLKKQNIAFKVIEAQDRLGGRIMTIKGKFNTPMEMGATWFAYNHKNLIQLIKELNLAYFSQHSEGLALFQTRSFEPPQSFYVSASEVSSYRIGGGSTALINALYNVLGRENILKSIAIEKIIDNKEFLTLIDRHGNTYNCKCAISAIPPQVFNRITIEPPLPTDLSNLFYKVQTWMAGATKFAVEYAKPFWLDTGFSGTVYSQTGLGVEIYDHSDISKTQYSLCGFLNGSAVSYDFSQRKKIIIDQLAGLFGDAALIYSSYIDKVWNDEFLNNVNTPVLMPHQNNGHPLFHQSYFNNKLFFAGAETATIFPGYMEGAVISANTATERVLKILRNKC
jgi:monoamine oxidase